MSKEILGFIIVVISALPMGIAEGKIINLHEDYSTAKVIPVVLLYLIGVFLYLIGFMQIPTKIGLVIGIWEIAAVTIAVTTAIYKNVTKFDKEYIFYYVVIFAATYVLGWAADRLFIKAGIN